jgi:hypothetical protein
MAKGTSSTEPDVHDRDKARLCRIIYEFNQFAWLVRGKLLLSSNECDVCCDPAVSVEGWCDREPISLVIGIPRGRPHP